MSMTSLSISCLSSFPSILFLSYLIARITRSRVMILLISQLSAASTVHVSQLSLILGRKLNSDLNIQD